MVQEAESAARRTQALITTENPPAGYALRQLLATRGFDVHTAFAGEEGYWLARTLQPDVILLAHRLPDMSGPDLCRILRQDPRVGPGTPILIMLPAGAGTAQRREALRANAWDVVTRPVDAEELLDKLETYVQAKRHGDRAWAEGLLDAATALYNAQGLTRRARELAAMAYRQRAPLACLTFGPRLEQASPTPDALARAIEHVARVFRVSTRESDVVGRIGPTEFALVALDTAEAGAVGCARRLTAAVSEAQPANRAAPPPRFRVYVGYDAVPNVREASVDVEELLSRATLALRWAEAAPTGDWIRRFDPGARSGGEMP